MFKELSSRIPECIRNEQASLKNVEDATLEQCSLVDMLVCQLIMRMVEMWNGDIPDPLNVTKKRRNRMSNDENSVPLVNSFVMT